MSAVDNEGRARITKLSQIYQSRNEVRAMNWPGTKTKKSKASGLDLETHGPWIRDLGPSTQIQAHAQGGQAGRASTCICISMPDNL